MLGGDLEAAARSERALLDELDVRPGPVAVDLGCGPGPDALALADLGCETVIGVDTCQALLDELAERARSRSARVETAAGDMLEQLPRVTAGRRADVIVCMRDTLLHLPSRTAVVELFAAAAAALVPGGTFVVSYRDLTQTLDGTDRFMTVRADDERIMLCALDYRDAETVIVNDLVYTRGPEGWALSKSSYPKQRLAPDWIREQLSAAGFEVTAHAARPSGLWVTAAVTAG